jgi:spore coat protein H
VAVHAAEEKNMRPSSGALWLLAVVFALFAAPGCKPRQDADGFFERAPVSELRIRLSSKQEEQLRHDPRRYVDCTLIENDKLIYDKIRVKLKGSAGSFREVDDRPSLTLSTKKNGERFHGLSKFHLNSSVQDESYLHELVASQVCAEAGCPTARVTHARVWFNDRDLGLYVLKEGYDEVFLNRHFRNSRGDLYDGGAGQDIDAELERGAGQESDDRSDLESLVEACREEDPERRWALIEERLDIDRFLNFVALELMLCHWDGYAQAHNNYRVYFRADDKKACFFPHGMDQILEDPNYSVFQQPNGLVARAVLENPVWQDKYRARVMELLPQFAPQKLQGKIDAGLARIMPAAEKIGADFAQKVEDQARGFRERAGQRQECILHPRAPEPIEFNAEGWVQIDGWEPRTDDDAKLEQQEQEGRNCLLIEVGPSKHCTASFRSEVLLTKGKYRLEGNVKTTDVVAEADDKGPGGAGLRISGAVRENQSSDSADWQSLSQAFEIEEDSRTVVLIAELRGSAGSALFELPSLRVVRLE